MGPGKPSCLPRTVNETLFQLDISHLLKAVSSPLKAIKPPELGSSVSPYRPTSKSGNASIYTLENCGTANFTKKHATAIYHASIDVYDTEIQYSRSGITLTSPAGTTKHGEPPEIFPIGETAVTEFAMYKFLDELSRNQFLPKNYDLLHNNCITFSEVLSQFLTGLSIPSHIKNLVGDLFQSKTGKFCANFVVLTEQTLLFSRGAVPLGKSTLASRIEQLEKKEKHVTAIYHASIDVFDTEIAYSRAGITLTSPPGTTKHGEPQEIHEIGKTAISEFDMYKFLDGISRNQFSPAKYSVVRNNCIIFAETLAQFLTGQSIPDKIKKLVDNLNESTIGQCVMRAIIAAEENLFCKRNMVSLEKSAIYLRLKGIQTSDNSEPPSLSSWKLKESTSSDSGSSDDDVTKGRSKSPSGKKHVSSRRNRRSKSKEKDSSNSGRHRERRKSKSSKDTPSSKHGTKDTTTKNSGKRSKSR